MADVRPVRNKNPPPSLTEYVTMKDGLKLREGRQSSGGSKMMVKAMEKGENPQTGVSSEEPFSINTLKVAPYVLNDSSLLKKKIKMLMRSTSTLCQNNMLCLFLNTIWPVVVSTKSTHLFSTSSTT